MLAFRTSETAKRQQQAKPIPARRSLLPKRAAISSALALALLAATPLAPTATTAAAQPAAAATARAAATAAAAGTDGCTKSPDSLPLAFDFYEACAAHDRCYTDDSPLRDSRGRCDWDFLTDMQDACNSRHWWAKPGCRLTACVYYKAVRAYGEHSYENRAIDTPLAHIAAETARRIFGVDSLADVFWLAAPWHLKAAKQVADLLAECRHRPDDYYFNSFRCACGGPRQFVYA